MRKVIVMWCIIAVLCITGCNREPSDTKTTTVYEETTTREIVTTAGVVTEPSTTSKKEEETEITEEERGEGQILFAAGEGDAERLGVDKTVVWIISDTYCPKEAVVSKFNELLVNKYGCDFVVEFKAYSAILDLEGKDYTYYEMVTDMMKLGHRADIIYSGNFGDYSNFVEEGVYVPLTDYFATEDGEKLYDAYAPEVWKKTARKGQIYGYISLIYPASTAIALCNKELATKYGIEVHKGEWDFYDVGEYLEASGVTKKDIAGDELLLVCWPSSLILMEGYCEVAQLGSDIYFKQDGNGGWTAVDLSKEANFIRLVKTIKEYSDKGWYTCMYGRYREGYDNERMGRYVFDFVNVNTLSGIMFTEDKFVCSDNTVLEVGSGRMAYGSNELMETMITGVTSWAEYEEEALKVITLINTEEELSNLLEYGIEGVDYGYKDRLVSSLIEDKKIELPVGDSGIANMNILHSILADPEDKVAYSKQISANVPDGPTMMYDIDMSDYEEQMKKISEIYTEYEEKLFEAQYDDVEAAVAQMGAELAAAGIDEVIAELNRQMKGQ